MLKGTDILHITQNIILNRVGSLPHWACSLLEKKKIKKEKKAEREILFIFFYLILFISCIIG